MPATPACLSVAAPVTASNISDHHDPGAPEPVVSL